MLSSHFHVYVGVYRDLSKPMGAINAARLADFLDRYESFSENETIRDIPPFMYGSHYSTMVGVVLHFLLRLQPFASLHKEMQNGRFDVADRLFSSIPMTFLHNTTQLSEVRISCTSLIQGLCIQPSTTHPSSFLVAGERAHT